MKALLANLSHTERFTKTLAAALFVGLATTLVVLTVQQSHDYTIRSVANFLGNTGNDLFLVLSNLLIIGWAWRKRLMSVIRLTLSLDLSVWILVQGIKLLHIEPWYLRPNGGTGGFPSGHATHAFGMAFLLTLYFPRLAWFWYTCAAAISWSRVETEWHTGFQVAAGIALGIGLVWVLAGKWCKHPDAAIIKTKIVSKRNRVIQVQESYVAE